MGMEQTFDWAGINIKWYLEAKFGAQIDMKGIDEDGNENWTRSIKVRQKPDRENPVRDSWTERITVDSLEELPSTYSELYAYLMDPDNAESLDHDYDGAVAVFEEGQESA